MARQDTFLLKPSNQNRDTEVWLPAGQSSELPVLRPNSPMGRVLCQRRCYPPR